MQFDAPERDGSAALRQVSGETDYPLDMATFSARDVAAEVRRRLPGVPVKKLHKLLYYAQGHHLATFGEPLFVETISAWDRGPVVGALWHVESQEGVATDVRELGEAELNTVGYVLSRYGRLSGGELERLTHGESPWVDADASRRAHGSRTQRIEASAIRAFFAVEPDGEDLSAPPVDPETIATWLSGARPAEPDDRTQDTAESLLARLR